MCMDVQNVFNVPGASISFDSCMHTHSHISGGKSQASAKR